MGLIDIKDSTLQSESLHSTIHEWVEENVNLPRDLSHESSSQDELSGDTLRPSDARDCLQLFDGETQIGSDQAAFDDGSNPSRSPASFEEKPMHFPAKASSPSQSMSMSSPTADVWPMEAPKRTGTRTRGEQAKGIIWQEAEHDLETPRHKSTRPARASNVRQKQSLSHCFAPKLSTRSSAPDIDTSITPTSQSGLSVVPSHGHDPFKYYGPRPLAALPITPTTSDIKSPRSSHLQATKHEPLPTPSSDDSQGQASVISSPLPPVLSSPNESPRFWELTPHGKSSPLRLLLSSPGDLPRAWVNRFCSAQWFGGSFDAVAPTEGPMPPSTALLEDRLHVCFPEHITAGIYEVQLDMDVCLSQPDALGWQSLSISSLSTESCLDMDGLIELSLVTRSVNDVGPLSTQIDPTGFLTVENEQDGGFKGTYSYNERFSLRMRLKAAVHRLELWNSTVTLYTTMSYSPGQGMRIRYSASLTVDHPKEDYFAERIVFAILVKNGPQNGGLYRLRSGQSIVQLAQPAVSASDTSTTRFAQAMTSAKKDGTVEILIERDSCDLEKRLGLEFTCRLYLDMGEASMALPVISPKLGKVLSEKIWVLKPSPPLKLHAVSRPFLSTWQVSKRTVAKMELVCFHRIEVPTLFPPAFTEDAVVHIRTFNRTLFDQFAEPASTLAEGPSTVVPSLNMTVDVLPKGRLEYRLFFDLEIMPNGNRLLQVDPVGWQPKYALVNGHLSTANHAPWYDDDESFISMFRSSWMKSGHKLQLEMSFVQNRCGDFTANGRDWVESSYPLPRVTDKVILGGALTCNCDNAVVALVYGDTVGRSQCEEYRFSDAHGKERRRLPSLGRGYRIHLELRGSNPVQQARLSISESVPISPEIRFSKGLSVQPRTIRFDDEQSNSSNDDDEEGNGPDYPRGTEREDTMESNGKQGPSPQEVDGVSPNSASDNIFPIDVSQFTVPGPKQNDGDKNGLDRGDDIPGSSDEYSAHQEDQSTSTSGEEEEDEPPGLGDLILAFRVFANNCVVLAAWVIRYLEQRSLVHFLIRFLMLEFIVCLSVPWAYLDAQPSRTVQSVVSNVMTHPGEIFVGGFEAVARPNPAAILDQLHGVQEAEGDDGQVVVMDLAEDTEEDMTLDIRGQSWRDRVDLALGWRPVS